MAIMDNFNLHTNKPASRKITENTNFVFNHFHSFIINDYRDPHIATSNILYIVIQKLAISDKM